MDEFSIKTISEWPHFLKEEFRNTFRKYSNSSTSRSDHISWRYLKIVVNNDKCLFNIINIANTCINLRYWPSHFKTSTLIIIPKPNKVAYNSPKIFYPIVLLNTLEKLIKKIISERMQTQSITLNFVHSNQLDILK